MSEKKNPGLTAVSDVSDVSDVGTEAGADVGTEAGTEAATGTAAHRIRRSPRQKAQEALATADRKIERAKARKAEALATMQTIGGEINRLQAERDYLASHPALKPTVFDRVSAQEVVVEQVQGEQDEMDEQDEVGDGFDTETSLDDDEVDA